MRYRIDEPVFTRVHASISGLVPGRGSTYIYGESPEERSTEATKWSLQRSDMTTIRVVGEDVASFEAEANGQTLAIRLRSERSIQKLLDDTPASSFYLDITGLSHHVWAPLLKALRCRSQPTYVVYAEPGDYRWSAAPTESTIFDLSERVHGIAPIPGFASLASSNDRDALFVPLLGFEGARFAHVLEAVQPKGHDIYPVIGVPGFRPEYPFHAYLGNRMQLVDTRAWTRVRYASANCPFSLYGVLKALAEKTPDRPIKIALIGTKPHALGAVLYHLDNPHTAELVYDHPVRKPKRTAGTGRVCVYDLGLLPQLRVDRDQSLSASHAV